MKGTCRRLGDDVNTDEIIPARYLNTTDEAELAAHCMEGADPDFVNRARAGDIVVAGRNFGCGSSREHAPVSIKAFGVGCVVAETFARIFFRNSVNTGLPIAECPEAAREAQEGDEIEVNFASGTVQNYTRGTTHKFQPFPSEVRRIIDAGGLMAFLKQQVGK